MMFIVVVSAVGLVVILGMIGMAIDRNTHAIDKLTQTVERLK